MKMLQSIYFTVLLSLILSQSYAQEYQILNYVTHGEVYSPDTISYVDGNSINLTRIEIRGIWEGSSSPSPAQALTWFSDTEDDCPLAPLDWASVAIDTTWKENSDGTLDSILTNIRKRYRNGAWDATPVTTGWMAEDEVYTIEIQSVIGETPTTIETFVFDIAGTIDFGSVEYRVNYDGKRTGTQITEGEAYVRFRFNDAARPVVLPAGTEFLRINWMNAAGTFYTMDYPIEYIPVSELGLNLTITPEAYPPAGYFSAGDTVDVQVVLTNDGGTELKWDESATNGLDRLYYYLDGPKQDYEKIHYSVRVISSGILQTDDATGQPFVNPLKLVLPDTLPGDVGTYTIMIRVRRFFAGTTYFAQLEDIQVGTTTVTDIPVGNCESCHNEQSTFPDMPVLENHGYSEWPQCLICHTDDQGAAFSKIVHEKTMVNTHFTGDKGDCSLCHIDKSNDQFTSDAEQVCTACHNPTPYFPSDHAANAPLHAESGISCATQNCHQFGGLGVFKTIDETHAGLAAKYVGGTLTASSTATAPVIDGVIDAAWDNAASITTLRGAELKALYDDTNIYFLAQWVDGHNLMTGSAGPTESIDKNLWSHDGEAWSKSGNEDRFAFLWDAGDSFGASCANMCHSDGSMATSDGNADVWHWKAVRTNPLGLTDDKWWSGAGRGSDAKTVSAYNDNINLAGDGPLYSGPITDGHFIIIAEGGSTNDLETDINTANTYPGYYLNANAAISGESRWDVKTVGKFDDQTGKWTVEFQRAMDTGNADDVVFLHDSEINFSTATFDNTGGGHASQGMDVGVYTLQIGPVATGIEENINSIPVAYSMAQNYPNPFNPTTRIEFGLKEAGHVSLSIYDVLGQEVMKVVDRSMKAGHHWLTIKAKNLGSGIYFYKLSVNDFTAVKKMILLK
jgi:hypothetical protein